MMDTFQASSASNVPTREKPSNKRGDLYTSRMARFGRETALSRDYQVDTSEMMTNAKQMPSEHFADYSFVFN